MSRWDLPMGWQDVSAYENQRVQFTTLKEKRTKMTIQKTYFSKFNTFMIKKTLNILEIEENQFKIIKVIYEKLIAGIIPNGKNNKSF